MKRSLQTIGLIIVSAVVIYAQNHYIDYYNLLNEGDRQLYLGNDSIAYIHYQKAFSKVDYVHSGMLIKGAELAAINHDIKNAYIYSLKAVRQGAGHKFHKKKSFANFRKSRLYKDFKDSLKLHHRVYKDNLNKEYKYLIDSLYYLDQRIIRNNRTVKGKYQIDKLKLPKNRFDLDSLIFADILTLIDQYGFPTEENIGRESFSKVWIFYHHNIRLPQNEKYIELAQKAVKEGAYFPMNYAWMYDQSRIFKNEDPYFYFGVVYTVEMDEEKKKEINTRRSEWGIKPMEAQQTIQRGGTLIQKNLW